MGLLLNPLLCILGSSVWYFSAILSRLKIPCLETDRKDAKQTYQDHLNAYTKDRLGRPLEKLHVSFFSEYMNKV